MQFRRSPGVRAIDAEWHEERQRAREQAYNSDLSAFFSDVEIIKYNLETAQIDGSDNPQTYTINRPIDIWGVNGTDIRDLKDR